MNVCIAAVLWASWSFPTLHLRLDILAKSLELLHVTSGGRPVNAQSFRLVWLGNLNKRKIEFRLEMVSEDLYTMWK